MTATRHNPSHHWQCRGNAAGVHGPAPDDVEPAADPVTVDAESTPSDETHDDGFVPL